MAAPTLDQLTAVTAVDGRYGSKTEDLRNVFSEYGLIQRRVKVEVEWLLALADAGLVVNPKMSMPLQLPDSLKTSLKSVYLNFSVEDAKAIKNLEATTNHDVKAVEYWLKTKVDEHCAALTQQLGFNPLTEYVHFGCTSEDINNLAYGLMLKDGKNLLVVKMQQIIDKLLVLVQDHHDKAMLSLTHGQPATPTTFGKEMRMFAYRLTKALNYIKRVPILGKINGATGNFNAHYVAFPKADWPAIAQTCVANLDLEYQPLSTQIECHDWCSELADHFVRFNTVMIDFSRDMWSYVMRNLLKLKVIEGEVGSSAMPHKVNPIDFENCEGNLGVANALLTHLSQKLPISRMQRDLTDSTVQRTWGTAFGHCTIAYAAAIRAIGRIDLNEQALAFELDNNWAVLAEPIQTVMRKAGIDKPYERLKELTRGTEV
jgi:adenylosuccinate lyase